MSSRQPEWTAITVTRNSSADLRRYWSEIIDLDVQWIVVDNASTDDSVSVAESLGAEVISLPTNIGFSHANNRGFAEVSSEFVAFVNPDVTITKTGLAKLGTVLREQDVLLAPQLVNPDGSLQPNGRGLPFLVDKVANRKVKLPGAKPEQYTPVLGQGIQNVDWITGAVVAARTTTFATLGHWNEKFFLYCEDQELSLRAWDRGIPVAVDTSVQWVHGWKRETSGFKFTPWRREIASLTRFYLMYPRLLFPFQRENVNLGKRRHS